MNSDHEIVDSPGIPVFDEVMEITASPSPDMRPTNLPSYLETMEDELREPFSSLRFS